MCGLFGWQFNPANVPDYGKRKRLAEALTTLNDTRGGQSWGAWSQDLVLRGLGKSSQRSKMFASLHCAMGHTRWATHGANVIENTHPFIDGGVALSHNGDISNHRALNEKYQRDHEVDSEHLLSHMLDDKPFSEIEAYGAITWVDLEVPHVVRMGRLSQRGEFAVCKLKNGGVVWSSSEEHLADALKYSGLKLEFNHAINPGIQYYAEDGLLYIDKDATSILVNTPVVTRHWSEFMVDWRESTPSAAQPTQPTSYDDSWDNYSGWDMDGVPLGSVTPDEVSRESERQDVLEGLAQAWMEGQGYGMATSGMAPADVLDEARMLGFDEDEAMTSLERDIEASVQAEAT